MMPLNIYQILLHLHKIQFLKRKSFCQIPANSGLQSESNYRSSSRFATVSNPITDYLLFCVQNSNLSSGVKQPTCQVAFRKAALNLTGYNHAVDYSPHESPKAFGHAGAGEKF